MGQKYIWKIENFSRLMVGTIQSKTFVHFAIIINPFFSSECISIEVKQIALYRRYSNSSIALLDAEGSPLLWRQKNVPFPPFQFCVIKRDVIFGSMRDKFLPNDTLRVQYLIWNAHLLNPISNFACTRINLHKEVIEKTLSWNIVNINPLGADQTEKHELFTNERDAKLLTSNGDELTIRLFLDSSLCVKLSVSLDEVHLKCIISVVDNKGKTIEFANEEYYFCKKDEVWTFNIPITRDLLANYRNEFLTLNRLSLKFACTFTSNVSTEKWCTGKDIFVDTSHPNVTLPITPAPRTSSEEPENKKQKLSNNTISQALVGILKEGFMSDFSFRVQDKTFPVHKAILSARSSVFRSMFTVDMKENESSSVDIKDVEVDTFQRMLNFIYSDSFEYCIQWESASKLYSVAKKYAVEPLKQKCSQVLMSGLCVSSVLDVLVLGDMHHDDELTTAAVDFVARNDKEIIASERWKKFLEEHVRLALDTLQKLYQKKMSL